MEGCLPQSPANGFILLSGSAGWGEFSLQGFSLAMAPVSLAQATASSRVCVCHVNLSRPCHE